MTDVGILGGDAVRGNPDGLASVGRFLHETADDLDGVRNALQRGALHESWQGAAADAFRELLDHTPDDLTKAAGSYRDAAQAVSEYTGRLRGARDLAQHLADQLAQLQGQAGAADQRVRNAQHLVDDARRQAAHASAQARAHAQRLLDQRLRELANLKGQRAALQGQIEAIRRRAAQNRHDLDRAADWARDRLHEASRAGVRNSVGSWLDRHSHVLKTIGHGTVTVLKVVGKTLIDAVLLPIKIAEYIKDPSWARLSDLLDNLSAALTVATIALTVLLVVGTGGAGLALVPEIIAGLKMAQVGVAAAKVGVDGYRKYGLHETSVSTLDIGLDVLGVVGAGQGARGAMGSMKRNWASALHGPAMSENWKKYAARVIVFNEGKPTSSAVLEKEMTKYVRDLVVDPLADAGKDYAMRQATDFAQRHVPVLREVKDLDKIEQLVGSGATIVRHEIKVRPTHPVREPMAAPSGAMEER